MTANVNAGVEFIELDAVVLRACQVQACGSYHRTDCPKHSKVEDLGAIVYWHKNPLRRLAYRASRFLQNKPVGKFVEVS